MEIIKYVTTDIPSSVFEFINNICITIQLIDDMWPLHKTIKNQSLLPSPLITKVDIITLLYVQQTENEAHVIELQRMLQEYVLCTGSRPCIHKDFTLCKKSLHKISYYMTLYKAENYIYLLIFYS